jgi:hypothetical protein
VFSLNSSISLVVMLAVHDVGLVVGVDSLVGPLIVVSGGDVVEALGREPGADHGGGEEVSVVESNETTG